MINMFKYMQHNIMNQLHNEKIYYKTVGRNICPSNQGIHISIWLEKQAMGADLADLLWEIGGGN